MKRTLIVLGLLVALAVPGSALTLQEAKDQATTYISDKWENLLDQVRTCVTSSTERGAECHTAWSVEEENYCVNDAGSGATICTMAQTDSGLFENTNCGGCYNGLQTWALAGYNIQANAPINARINIALAPGGGRGEQVLFRFEYDGTLYESAYADASGIFPAYDWTEVVEIP